MEIKRFALWAAVLLVVSCGRSSREATAQMEYAQWFRLLPGGRAVVLQPGGGADTLSGPCRRFVCMSSSYVGFLEALGADSTVVGVSGLSFLGNEKVLSRAREVGYDAALSYETILELRPHLFITYSVGAVKPPCLDKLQELGIRTVVLSEHLEHHPLARAEYVKLFGLLIGREALADSLFSAVKEHYLSLVRPSATHKVLINIPYKDQWFIPGGDNYMTRLIQDAGGQVLGARPGREESSVIDVETAWRFSKEADVWLHPGWCRSLEELRAVHPLFPDFPVLEKAVWNNTLQSTPGGGNRYWETGPVRPDLLLQDLVGIFDGSNAPMNYYCRLLPK